MQTVSSNYNPYADIINVGASVEFSLIATNASKVATTTAPPATPYTSIEQTHNEIMRNTLKLASFETDLWALDGSFQLPSKTKGNGETGWFSETMSDANGNINLSITYTFPVTQNSAGFTIIFDTRTEEAASDFTVTTYNGSSVISTLTITGNTDSKVFFDLQSYGYNKITVKFTKTAKPYRRIRLTEFVFGQTVKFDSSNIINMRIVRQTSKYGENLPASMLTLTIDNSDNSYNVLNPFGVYRFLQEGQGLTVTLSINGENVEMGKFYFESAKANDDALTATITAYDLMWRLDKTICDIGKEGTWSAGDAVRAILDDAGLTDVTVNIDSTPATTTLFRAIPQGTSHREALRMVAQAARMALYFDRSGALRGHYMYQAFPQTVNARITPNNMQGFGDANDKGSVNLVKMMSRNEYTGASNTYTSTNQIAGEPAQTLTLSNPILNVNGYAAIWVLFMNTFRNHYSIPVQSNPALDLLDTVRITNIYGDTDNCMITKIETIYDGSLIDNIEAIAELRTPKLLNVSNVSGGVKVEWQRVAGAAAYRIFSRPVIGGTGWTGQGQVSGDMVSFTVPSAALQPNTAYSFTVRCEPIAGNTTYTSYYNQNGLTITTAG